MAEQMMQNKAAEMAPKQTIPAGYKQTEVGVIPEDWDVKRISDIADVFSGGTPNRENPKYWDGNVPWITTTLIDGKDIIEANEFITEAGVVGSSVKWCRPGAILMAMYGQGKTRGKVAILSFNATINQACAAIELKDLTSSVFILHVLSHMYKTIRELSNSGGQENLSGFIIKNIRVPYPPKQERIAIANSLSDTDALIAGLEQLIAKKQAIKTATMHQLLTGRTRLPQFALRPDGTPKGYKLSELGDIPEDWDVLSYGDIFTFLSTATNSRADLSNSGDFGYIHYGDIHTELNNNLDLCEFELPRISCHLVSSSFVENGDVIMADASEDYEGIGKSVEIRNIGSDKIVAGLHTFLLRDKNKLLADGYRGYLHCITAVKKSFDRLATGMKVYGISKNNLMIVPVPLPPKYEQTAIAAILSDMDSELTVLEQKLTKARSLKQGMMQQLLTGRIRLPLPQEA